MAEERPIEFLFEEQRTMVFFNSFIVQLEAQGYTKGDSFYPTEDGWAERLLHYNFRNVLGVSEVELSIDGDKVYVQLKEHWRDGRPSLRMDWKWNFKTYSLTKALTKIELASEITGVKFNHP